MADAPQTQKKGAAFVKWTKEHPIITVAAAVCLFALLYASFVGKPSNLNSGLANEDNATSSPSQRGSLGSATLSPGAIPGNVPATGSLPEDRSHDNQMYQTFVNRCHEQADKRHVLGIDAAPQITDNGPGGVGRCHIDATFVERGAL